MHHNTQLNTHKDTCTTAHAPCFRSTLQIVVHAVAYWYCCAARAPLIPEVTTCDSLRCGSTLQTDFTMRYTLHVLDMLLPCMQRVNASLHSYVIALLLSPLHATLLTQPYTHTHIYTHAHAHMHTHTHTRTRTHAHTHTHAHAHAHTRTHTHCTTG
jgi:hypothetical protein